MLKVKLKWICAQELHQFYYLDTGCCTQINISYRPFQTAHVLYEYISFIYLTWLLLYKVVAYYDENNISLTTCCVSEEILSDQQIPFQMFVSVFQMVQIPESLQSWCIFLQTNICAQTILFKLPFKMMSSEFMKNCETPQTWNVLQPVSILCRKMFAQAH